MASYISDIDYASELESVTLLPDLVIVHSDNEYITHTPLFDNAANALMPSNLSAEDSRMSEPTSDRDSSDDDSNNDTNTWTTDETNTSEYDDSDEYLLQAIGDGMYHTISCGDIWNFIFAGPHQGRLVLDDELPYADEKVWFINDGIHSDNLSITEIDTKLMGYNKILDIWMTKSKWSSSVDINIHLLLPTDDEVQAWPEWL